MMILMAAGMVSADLVFSQGFNAPLTTNDYYKVGTWSYGSYFGVSTPGYVTNGNGGLVGTEGSGFAAWNTGSSNAVPTIIAGMDFRLPDTVTAAGVTYTFSGDFGWRYAAGSKATVDDMLIRAQASGFVIGTNNINAVQDGTPVNYMFGTYAQGTWTTYTFNYTTIVADIGKPITLRVRFQDNSAVDSQNVQLLTDNWTVTSIPEPATIGMLGLGALVVLVLRPVRVRG
jgi:hypothetical protein